jgi:Tfp pilus assembly protein PilF
MSEPLRKISADEFARRLKDIIQQPDKRFAIFVGAGCSVSSGIRDASNLVRNSWLPRLRDFCSPDCTDLDQWAKGQFPDYDSQNPAALYGPLMERLFLYPEERQREIEDLCEGKFPGFGYATLSSLVTMEGGRFNVLLTTNFDDLTADALYLFTKARPLVIHHESLAGYIRPTRTRPLVIKLHGDYRLSPHNTARETQELKEDIEKQVRSVLHDRGLVFIGYGGNDQGIKKMLEVLPSEALPLGVYWTSGREPMNIMRSWLESRDAVWVEKGDFDELMLLVRDVFNLPHPTPMRFDEVFEKYKNTYDTLSRRIVSLTATAPDAAALKEAVRRTDESFPDWWAVEVAASRLKESDPDQADVIYRKGLQQFPQSAPLLSNYAKFLTDIRKDHDRAEEHYRRALTADPHNAILLGNYANFLTDIRKDHDRAEEHYRRALTADPNDATILGNYAGFLLARGRTQEGLATLERVLGLETVSVTDPLAAEGWFYAFVHRPSSGRREALERLKRALEAGARSPAWNLSANIAKAREEGHPDVTWLEKLATVISEGADIGILEAWDEWKSA